MRNTEQFVAGQAANNVLLTGARGTGKSSLVKACLNEFAPRGLRLIEVDKADLVDLPDIVDLVADAPRALHRLLRRPELRRGRARLQGAEVDPRRLGRRPPATNVLIYATSNRRHLLPEYMKENLELPAHRRRRGASGRGGRGEDLAVRALRPVGQLLSVQPARIPGDRRRSGCATSASARRRSPRRGRSRWSGRWSAARARAASPTSSPATTPAGTPMRMSDARRRERRSTSPSAC